jgi:NAD(P)-dependent dehydrogenase (short-subunit alcohol dehydrogenase family)
MATILITGANKGIGYETARQLIDLGHTVYVGARSAERGQKAAAGIGARFVQLDVTDDASVAAAMTTIGDAEGRLDVLVNNAGIAMPELSVRSAWPAALRAGGTPARWRNPGQRNR